MELKIGDLVKISFKHLERMWVKLTEINGDDMTGILENYPLDPDAVGVNHGDEVKFKRDDILDIQQEFF